MEWLVISQEVVDYLISSLNSSTLKKKEKESFK